MKRIAAVSIRALAVLGALFAWSVLTGASACASETAAQGREVLNKWEKAVISVKLTAKVRYASEGRQYGDEEQTQEIRATIVDPSGLCVCSLSEADPSQLYAAWAQEEGEEFQVEITAVKIRMPDGKEIAAKIVLRDKDLDLALIQPSEKPAEPLPAVDLTNAAAVEVLDEVVVIQRLGDSANRIPAAVFDQISAVMQKPRLFYVPGPNGMMSDNGCPVFTLDGKIVGILLNRIVPMRATEMLEDGSGWMTVILPAADVLEVAKQVPAAPQ